VNQIFSPDWAFCPETEMLSIIRLIEMKRKERILAFMGRIIYPVNIL
jgi:hypothetical protein